MNRNLTNRIRYLMDNFIPRRIRNSRWFMKPFFYFAYRGKNIEKIMNLKSEYKNYSEKDWMDLYGGLDSISRNRATDLNEKCLKYITNVFTESKGKLIDIGCGNFFLLKEIREINKDILLTGYDIIEADAPAGINYTRGKFGQISLAEKSFDFVICTHTLEHIPDAKQFARELIATTKKELIVVVPRQKKFRYTLDEHIHFFERAEDFTKLFGLQHYNIMELNGDWLFHARLL